MSRVLEDSSFSFTIEQKLVTVLVNSSVENLEAQHFVEFTFFFVQQNESWAK